MQLGPYVKILNYLDNERNNDDDACQASTDYTRIAHRKKAAVICLLLVPSLFNTCC